MLWASSLRDDFFFFLAGTRFAVAFAARVTGVLRVGLRDVLGLAAAPVVRRPFDAAFAGPGGVSSKRRVCRDRERAVRCFGGIEAGTLLAVPWRRGPDGRAF
jgi:hypothetical protein